MSKKSQQLCHSCGYAGTPDNNENCNYCRQSFSYNDDKAVSDDYANWNGIRIADLDLDNLPIGFDKTEDSYKFLESLIKYGNHATLQIFRLKGNADSFYTVITGNTYSSIRRFMEDSPHLQIFNIYAELPSTKDDEEPTVPEGTFGIVFEKKS